VRGVERRQEVTLEVECAAFGVVEGVSFLHSTRARKRRADPSARRGKIFLSDAMLTFFNSYAKYNVGH
jgi:hypothetical protein